MSKLTKTLLALAGIFVVVGGILMGVAIFIGVEGKVYWDSDEHKIEVLDDDDLVVLKKTKIDSFENVNIDTNVVDVELIPSDDYYVEYKLYSEDENNVYKVENGTFSLKSKDNYVFQFDMNFFSDKEDCYIKLYYPKDAELDSVYVGTSVGEVSVNGIKVDSITFDTSTGDINAKNVISKKIDCDTSVGEIYIESSETDELYASASTGDIDVKKTDIFKKARIDTSIGDINVSFGDKTTLVNYSISADTSVGDIEIDGKGEGTEFSSVNEGAASINCSTSTGDIYFTTK